MGRGGPAIANRPALFFWTTPSLQLPLLGVVALTDATLPVLATVFLWLAVSLPWL